MTVKECKRCGLSKDPNHFSKNNRYKKDGLENKCKDCLKIQYEKNRDKKLEAQMQWRVKNPDYPKKYMENAENFEARQAYEKQYYLQNKEKYLERKRQFRQNFPEKERRYIKDYKASHRDQINAYHRKWKAKKRVEDVQFKLKMNMSRRIRYELNTMDRTKQKKNKGTVEYIKCTAGFLKNHLEARFEIGMTWKNYGRMWHVDHIIPCDYWNLENAWESYLCWHYKNLSPLWASVNQSKKNSVDETRVLYYKTYMETLL